jgi:hypothetical protein
MTVRTSAFLGYGESCSLDWAVARKLCGIRGRAVIRFTVFDDNEVRAYLLSCRKSLHVCHRLVELFCVDILALTEVGSAQACQ